MVQLLILWGYIFAMNACIGTGVLKILEKCIYGWKNTSSSEQFAVSWTELAGVIAITVYAEIVSLFGAVGQIAHLLLLGLAVFFTFWCRTTIRKIAGKILRILFSWDGGTVSVLDFADCSLCITRTAAYRYGNLSCTDDSLV